MKPNTNGQAQPDLIKEATDAPKPRTYIDERTGEPFEVNDEAFANVLEMVKWLKQARDEKNARMDALEPEKTTQDNEKDLKERAG